MQLYYPSKFAIYHRDGRCSEKSAVLAAPCTEYAIPTLAVIVSIHCLHYEHAARLWWRSKIVQGVINHVDFFLDLDHLNGFGKWDTERMGRK